jgi:carbonic anhydrase/acetyltransferase-like protein (isoleucine patch superfamily)
MEQIMKYVLTKDTLQYNSRTLHRIKALQSFSNVKQGDLGGYVESTVNLSQSGDCWIYDDAKVYGNAMVCNSATVRGEATVWGSARVYDSATVCGSARVYDSATVGGEATVYDSATVFGKAEVCGEATVYDSATVWDSAIVRGTVRVEGHAVVKGNTVLTEGVTTYKFEAGQHYRRLGSDRVIRIDRVEGRKVYHTIVSGTYRVGDTDWHSGWYIQKDYKYVPCYDSPLWKVMYG